MHGVVKYNRGFPFADCAARINKFVAPMTIEHCTKPAHRQASYARTTKNTVVCRIALVVAIASSYN